MLYLNGGMPRSGTVWVLNVMDMLLGKAGRQLTKVNANSAVEVTEAIASYCDGSDRIIHFHEVTDAVFRVAKEPSCRVVFNHRDPRDIVVSQMNLHEVPFDSAVRMTVAACRSFTKAVKIDRVMLVPYAQIVQRPKQTVMRIARHLDVDVAPHDVDDVCRETSVEKYKKVMQDVNTEQVSVKSLFTGQREIRYDPNLFITDRHIQSGRIGRWRNELTPQQQKSVNATFQEFLQWLSRLDEPD